MLRPMRGAVLAAVLSAAVGLGSEPSWAHDLTLPLEQLESDVVRIENVVRRLRGDPLGGQGGPETADPRRVLGAAEIELALGRPDQALRILWARLEDPDFQRTPAYVPALLLGAEVLERTADDFGAMALSRQSLEVGGEPEQMAEAGARWFRLARRNRRLDGRIELLHALQRQGGLSAADPDVASQVRYEAAFALRAQQDFEGAQALLRPVPSEASFGSRAAYLAGVLYVQAGDLGQAERWFSAIMDWPIPSQLQRQAELEAQVRAHAALSAARLRYEAGDLKGALQAYRRVPEDSPLRPDACWELAYLSLEMEDPKRATHHLRCVEDLGVGGLRRVNAELFHASLLAHLGRYPESLARYDRLRDRFRRSGARFDRARDAIDAPAEFLFSGMERAALDDTLELSPGPPTLFQDAWTPPVRRAYRIDRGLAQVEQEVALLQRELHRYRELLAEVGTLPEVDFRRQSLRRLLRDIEHLIGHASELTERRSARLEPGWADLSVESERRTQDLRSRLRSCRDQVVRELGEVDREEQRRLGLARRELGRIEADLTALTRQARQLEAQGAPFADAAANQALDALQDGYSEAAMRAEVGALDTYWVKKQARTRAIERLLDRKKEMERQVDSAVRGFQGEAGTEGW